MGIGAILRSFIMTPVASRAILFSSIAVAAAAAVGAASLYFSGGAEESVNGAEIRRRLDMLAAVPPGIQPLAVSTTGSGAAPARTWLSETAPAVSAAPAARVRPAPLPVPARTVSSREPAESPVKNLALMGVTQRGAEEEAWLVDISSRERQTVGEGDEAWGFRVQQIEPASVRLVRDGDEYTLILGEKEIPGAQASAEAEEGTAGGGEGFFGSRGGSGRGPGGENEERERRREMFRQMMMSRGGMPGGASPFGGSSAFGGSPSFGGGFSGFRGSFTPSTASFSGSSGSPWRGSSSSGSSWRGSEGSRSPWRGGSMVINSGIPMGGSRFSGGGFGGGGSSSFSSSARSSGSTNPQTQRRQQGTGGRTTAGSQPIVNPQTQRRTGGAAASSTSSRSRSTGSFGGPGGFSGRSDRQERSIFSSSTGR